MATTWAEVSATVSTLPAGEQEAVAGWLLDRLGSAALVTIDEVFDVPKRRGPVAAGTVKAGTVEVGDALLLDTPAGVAVVRVGGIDKFQKSVPSAGPGEAVGLELVGVSATTAKGSKRLRGFGVRA